jgi:hypothetical protein
VPLSVRAGTNPYVGPLPYLSAAQNPFPLASTGLCLETLEDGVIDPLGVSGNGSFVDPGGFADSVDGDDGAIDGSGTGGHSYFGSGVPGITFTFDPQRAGGLPTRAGMAWTDGEGMVSFEAFDQNGASLGVHGPFDHADGSVTGTTAEDRFYGVTNAGGISAIKLTNTSGGIEVDHLTIDNTPPENCDPSVVTTTTTTSTSTSTSTTIPAGCTGVPAGPTFQSLNCRLADLIAATQAESRLGTQQGKLVKAAQKAKERKEAAEAECADGDARTSAKQLKKVVRKLIQFSHRLRSNNSRKNIPAQVREPLAATADQIQAHARQLRSQLDCAA